MRAIALTRGGDPAGYGRIQDRLRARFCGLALDRALAAGVPPDASAALALRARALTQTSAREELADQLRRIVRNACEPSVPGTRVRARREHVLAAEHAMQRLASRLQSPLPVEARGIARVRVLLSDGGGPLYYRASAQDLGTEIRQAISALGSHSE